MLNELKIADLQKIDTIVNELMTVLKPGLPTPKIKINNQQGNTLGFCHWQYGLKEGKPFWWGNTEIEIQKRVTTDERTLRRILAHELAHSEDFLVNEVAALEKYGYQTYKMMRGFNKDGGHGAGWMAVANRFNAKYGAGFVTKTSDQDIITDDTNLRPFYVLVSSGASGDKLGWQISLRLSPKQKEYLGKCADGKMTYPKKLFMSTDPTLLKLGAPMVMYGGSSIPKTDDQKFRLKELWDSGEDILQQFKPASTIETTKPQTPEERAKQYYNDLLNRKGATAAAPNKGTARITASKTAMETSTISYILTPDGNVSALGPGTHPRLIAQLGYKSGDEARAAGCVRAIVQDDEDETYLLLQMDNLKSAGELAIDFIYEIKPGDVTIDIMSNEGKDCLYKQNISVGRAIEFIKSFCTDVVKGQPIPPTSEVKLNKQAWARGATRLKTAKTRWESMMEEDKYKDWLPQAYARELAERWVEYVPIDQLLPLREYQRNNDVVEEMIEDIQRHGIRNPITIRYFKDTNRAIIIEGNHRVAAARAAGLKEVPARVTIASYPQKDYGHATEGGKVRGLLDPNERIFDDYVPPSAIGLTGHKKTAATVTYPKKKKLRAYHFKPLSFDDFCDAEFNDVDLANEDDLQQKEWEYEENVEHFGTLDFPVTTASHKQTPMSDTVFPNEGSDARESFNGEGTNGYVNQPERVDDGNIVTPDIESMLPKYASVLLPTFEEFLDFCADGKPNVIDRLWGEVGSDDPYDNGPAEDVKKKQLVMKFNKAIKKLHKVPFPATVYRKMRLKTPEQLRKHGVGLSWSTSERKAQVIYGDMAPGKDFLYRGEIDEDAVNWMETIYWRMSPMGNDEDELHLFKGAAIRNLSIKSKGSWQPVESQIPIAAALEGDGQSSFFEEVENPHSVQPLRASFCKGASEDALPEWKRVTADVAETITLYPPFTETASLDTGYSMMEILDVLGITIAEYMSRTEEQKKQLLETAKKQLKKSAGIKKSTPDFGYSNFKNRDAELSHLSWKIRKVGGCIVIKAFDEHGRLAGDLEVRIVAKTNGFVAWADIDDKWRGTGLGQLLYDKAIEECRRQGLHYFQSDKVQSRSEDADSAWRRLGQRYDVKHNLEDDRYYIDLRKTAGAGDTNVFIPRHHTEAPALHRDPLDPALETEQEQWDAALPDHKVGAEQRTFDFTDDYDIHQNHFDDEMTVAMDVLDEYKRHKNDPNYRMEWEVVPAARLIKIWNDYMKTGFVRDEKGIDMIAGIILTNIAKLNVNTILCGHDSQDPVKYAEEILDEELPEGYFDNDNAFFEDESGSWLISDYALKPLSQYELQLRQAKTSEQKLQIIDRILNIIHQRSDLAGWFVQGGRATLNRLAGTGDDLKPFKSKTKITNPLLKKKTPKPNK
jgi:GNAT superfamily N-acetyltransferase